MPTMTNEQLFRRNLRLALDSKLHIVSTTKEPFSDDQSRGYLKVTFEVIERPGKGDLLKRLGTLVESVPVQIAADDESAALDAARIQALTRFVSVLESLKGTMGSSLFSDAAVVAWKPGIHNAIATEKTLTDVDLPEFRK